MMSGSDSEAVSEAPPTVTYTYTYTAHRLLVLSSEDCGWRVASVVRRRRAVQERNQTKPSGPMGAYAAGDGGRPWPLSTTSLIGIVVGLAEIGGHAVLWVWAGCGLDFVCF